MYIATRGKKTAHLTTEAQAELYRKNGWEVKQEGGGGRSTSTDAVTDTPDEQMGYTSSRRGGTRDAGIVG